MPRFLHQVSYTSAAMARLLADPQDRFAAVRGPIEKLGGKIEHGYFSFGEHDAVLITEMPDTISAAAIALAFAAGGALKSCTTTPLLTTVEAMDAMRKAASCGYQPIAAAAGAAGR
ncbi:MAG TPA: GYD domain-containing protein [Candidatus Acidoferrum sp.]|nr:GYD domain-containing protein [Candidatus Acidoferrum sp.]